MPSTYDLEFNITWFELAPSLQTIFLTLQKEMSTLQLNYTVMINTLDQMQQQITTNTNNININAQEIIVIKQNISLLQNDVANLTSIFGTLDLSTIGSLANIQADLDQCILDINQLFKRMRAVEAKSEQNLNSIVDLRTDVDEITELLFILQELSTEIPDLRIDVDTNTEWIYRLANQNEILLDCMTELQIDMDHNVEWMNRIHDRLEGFIDEIVNLRIDIDLVTGWYQDILDTLVNIGFLDPDLIKNLFDDAVDLRIDVDELTERLDIAYDLAEEIPDLRTDVDINTEWLQWLDDFTSDIPDMRADIDNNTEWLNRLDRLVDDVTDLTQDVYQNIEDIQDIRDILEVDIHFIETNREDIDINTEMIQEAYRQIEEMPNLIMERVEKLMNKMRFLNIAPKINFLQEDIVECYPYYRMNNMTKAVLTADLDSAEVVYFIANDGISTTNFDLYCAYRNNDTQEFYFSNSTLNPMCFLVAGNKESHITDIMTADDNYIIAYNKFNAGMGTDGWYLIKTNHSRNAGSWTICKNLNPIWSSNVVGAKYYEDDDILFLFVRDPLYADLRQNRIAILRTYNLSTLASISNHDLINPFQLMECNPTTTSFRLTSIQQNFLLGNTADLGIGIDSVSPGAAKKFRMVFTVYDEEELIVMELFAANMIYVPAVNAVPGNTTVESEPCYIKLTFDCPKSIMQGTGSASVICLQNIGDLVFDCANKGSIFYQNHLDTSFIASSYASSKDLAYLCWNEFSTYHNWFKRYHDKVQRPASITDQLLYGTISPFMPDNPLDSPDASPWGKWFFKYTMAWDRFFINCESTQYGKCVIMIKDWVTDPSDVTALLAKAGSYFKVDPIQVFTEYGSSSCKDASGNPRYFHTLFTGSKLEVYEYIHTETATNFVVTKNLLKSVSVNTATWTTTASAGGNVMTPSFNPLTTTAFYNVLSDDFVIAFSDNTLNSSAWMYSDYGFLAIVNSSGTMTKVFGSSDISSYPSNWGSINNYVQLAKPTNGATPRVKCMTFYSATSGCCCFFYNCVGYSNEDFKNVMFTFNSAKTSMNMTNAYNYNEQQYTDELGRGTGVIYSGPKYGLTYSGETLDYSYTSFLTQKPIPSTWGTANSESNFLIGNFNRYKIQLKSSSGLVVYTPNIGLFLGGYYTQLKNPIAIVLEPNATNYIYLERDQETLEIIGFASQKKLIGDGAKVFNRICIAKVVTNSDDVISIEYFKINIGYNDYAV